MANCALSSFFSPNRTFVFSIQAGHHSSRCTLQGMQSGFELWQLCRDEIRLGDKMVQRIPRQAGLGVVLLSG